MVTALGDELRKKYKTPQEAIQALGLDASLLAADPAVSEPQRKAMWSAAKGESTIGIPEKVGKEFVGKDKSMKTAKDIASVRVGDAWPKSARDAFEKMVGKDKADEFCAKDWDPDEAEDEFEKEDDDEKVGKDKKAKDAKRADDKKAMDAKRAKDKKAKDSEEEEPEEVNEGKKEVDQTEDKKGARDKKAKDSKEDDDKAMDKQAMDEAIETRVDARVKEAQTNLRDRFAAARLVERIIGQVDPMAFDSADAIKIHTCQKRGIKGAEHFNSAALDHIISGLPSAGARPIEHTGKPPMAMDSTTRADALKYAPGLAKVTIGV